MHLHLTCEHIIHIHVGFQRCAALVSGTSLFLVGLGKIIPFFSVSHSDSCKYGNLTDHASRKMLKTCIVLYKIVLQNNLLCQ